MTRELSVEKLHLGRAVSFNRFDIMKILKSQLAPNFTTKNKYCADFGEIHQKIM